MTPGVGGMRSEQHYGDGGGSQGQSSIRSQALADGDATSDGEHRKERFGRRRQGRHSLGGSIKAVASLTAVMDFLEPLMTSLAPLFSVLRAGAVFEEKGLSWSHRCGYCGQVGAVDPGK